MKKTFLLLLSVCLAAAAQTAREQENDITILAGALASHTAEISIAPVQISTGTSAAGEISYARRIFEHGSSTFDVELPFIGAGSAQVHVTSGALNASSAMGAFTPGLRWRPVAGARLSPLAFAGIGPGWEDAVNISVSEQANVAISHGVVPVFSFGGGADLRLSRHVAFRGQLRDLVMLNDASAGNRHRLMWAFGFSFKW